MASPKYEVRVDEPEVADYLAKLTGKARADTIRRWLREGLDREPDNATVRAIALQGDAAALRSKAADLEAEGARLLSTAAEERIHRSAQRENAKAALLEALQKFEPAYWEEVIDAPAIKAVRDGYHVGPDFVLQVIREARP